MLNLFIIYLSILFFSACHASQTYYIDPTLTSDGVGTFESPWNTFAHIMPGGAHTFSGLITQRKDNVNNIILIKADSEIRETLRIQFGDNFIVGMYGEGQYPIINGSNIVISPWIQESSLWYLESLAESRALYIKSSSGLGSIDDIQLKARVNKADVTLYQQWYDSANQRLYADFGSQNPNTMIVEISTRQNVVFMRGCHNYIIQKIHAMKGDNANLVASNVTDKAQWLYNKSTFAGSWKPGGRTTMSIYGASTGGYATGVIIRGNVIRYAQNTGLEMGNLDGALVEENDIQYVGMGIELWETVVNSRFSRNFVKDVGSLSPDGSFSGHGNGFWVAPNVSSENGGYSDNNLFDYNIILRTIGSSIDMKSGSNNRFYNNVLALSDEQNAASQNKFVPMLYIDDSDGAAASIANIVKNNVFYQRTQHRFLTAKAGTNPLLNNNQYYSEYQGAAFSYFHFNGTLYSGNTPYESFNNYRISTGQDGDGAYGDPLFAYIDNDDVRIYPASPLIDNGATVGLTGDFINNSINGLPDMGVFEYQTSDTDMDGLTDSFEQIIGTNELLQDTDNDGLSDYIEVNWDGDASYYTAGLDTDPLLNDTDGDGINDGMEANLLSDPLDSFDTPVWGDTNGDGIVNTADIVLTTRALLGSTNLDNYQLIRSNVAPLLNGQSQYPPIDGFDLADHILILRKVLDSF